ncbi:MULTISPECIES: helix-turn-helix domain-containing protein [Alicyclobacillus]|uniref:Helix-turn-helix transcriptional regulator n=1 Tax=Alicyclobacillus acidoterrestris (strain ATCC 49025 / DSM 3922 / CIP 106132 / NCIMB 13137 / GD3B) TaxID=1356854 RepID=T0BTV0_ALIAG|nr:MULTISPECIES: helix-turn-helix transcriptional regulator [Alicyclobacillus]EPZ47503.1 hypothetical protein N007_06085 [Alicyclobacillus acidoterrestris ATCC 49025]UNO48592.1 helix-turn-helix transcriptional regulator [Alicyclobacillus acidoterrestris]
MSEPWQALQEARCARGWTQAMAARGIVSQSHYSLIEQGVLVPNPKVIGELAARFELNATKWEAMWSQYRRQFRARQRCWRAFAHDGQLTRADVSALQRASLSLDYECYQQFLDIPFSDPAVMYRRLVNARNQLPNVQAPHVPARMRPFGDIRLRIVLAIVESHVLAQLKRFQAATVWRLQAQQMMKEVPVFWR